MIEADADRLITGFHLPESAKPWLLARDRYESAIYLLRKSADLTVLNFQAAMEGEPKAEWRE